ncbi:MAG TPA: nuclear transport factor 2 family protein [Clostridia bacterium]|nr:nuclear transport factor 2 family protein [Clostridia bacterium]
MTFRSVMVASMLCFVLAASAVAQGTMPQSGKDSGDPKVAQQIRDLETKGREALLKADSSWAQQHLANDFMGISGRGVASDKQTSIANRQSGKLKYDSLNWSEMTVRVLGDAAIVSGKVNLKGTFEGRDISGDYMVTRVWAKRGGQWQIVSSQSTRIEQPQTSSR